MTNSAYATLCSLGLLWFTLTPPLLGVFSLSCVIGLGLDKGVFLGWNISWVTVFWKKIYIVYDDLICSRSSENVMNCSQNVEEVRWQVVKAMLDDFPVLRKKVKDYIQ